MPSGPRRYLLSPEARSDLERIWHYNAENWSIAQADDYHLELMTAIEAAARDPSRGRIIDHIRPGYRRISAGSHVIFFRAQGDITEIIRILHARMDFFRHI